MDEQERTEQDLEAMEETLSDPALTLGQTFSIRIDQGPDGSASAVKIEVVIEIHKSGVTTAEASHSSMIHPTLDIFVSYSRCRVNLP